MNLLSLSIFPTQSTSKPRHIQMTRSLRLDAANALQSQLTAPCVLVLKIRLSIYDPFSLVAPVSAAIEYPERLDLWAKFPKLIEL